MSDDDLVSAASEDNIEWIEWILTTKNVNVNFQARDGQTALYMAASRGHDKAVKKFLDFGAKPDECHRDNWTALYVASQSGYHSTCELLLEHGANIKYRSPGGFTALHISAGHAHSEVVRVLLEHGAPPQEMTDGGETPLYKAAVRNCPEAIQLLVKHGAKIEQAHRDGWSALYVAAQKGNIEAARCLLECGADVQYCFSSETGQAPPAIFIAIKKRQPAMIELLASWGANVDEPDNYYKMSARAFAQQVDETDQTLIKAMERGHQTYLEKQEASAHLASYLPKDLLGLYLAYM